MMLHPCSTKSSKSGYVIKLRRIGGFVGVLLASSDIINGRMAVAKSLSDIECLNPNTVLPYFLCVDVVSL